ncbi:MAG: hypothetical protein WBM84_17210 [Sedimenticolaceae bacterium]
MSRCASRLLSILGLFGLMAACGRDVPPPGAGLLQHVPSDTPYVFVTRQPLPDALRRKLGDHYAAQLAAQRAAIVALREQMDATEDAASVARQAAQAFDAMDALFAEFEGRDTAAAVRELGIEPVPRLVLYGIGLLPAMRAEIADAARLNEMLDRVERRAGVTVQKSLSDGQAYRRFDLGEVDAVLAVTASHLIAGLLPDAYFDRDLPLLLGQRPPERSLAAAGDIETLIERHGFTGYGEGFLKLDELLGTMLGRGTGRNMDLMQGLGGASLPVSRGCVKMMQDLVAGMPRMVVGVTAAGERRIAARGIWEGVPAVTSYLQKLAAPVPGLGGPYDGLISLGLGLNLPQLRNTIDALLDTLIAAGSTCEWVNPASLQAVMPQLNLALGPMTAGIKGFNLRVDDLTIDPQTLQPSQLQAGLLAALDDPRGIFALGAMFNPALAALEVPNDGTVVDLPQDLGLNKPTPPLKVAMKDRALVLLAGGASDALARSLLDADLTIPPPLFAMDYGIFRLVERFGGLMAITADRLSQQGEQEMAQQLLDQLAGFRVQAQLFERLRVSVYASAEGLVMDQVMELR